MTNEERSEMLAEMYRQQQMYGGCGSQLMLYVLVGVIVLLFASCSTKSIVESDVSYQKLTEATQRMDSLIHTTSTWQQSIFQQQTLLIDSFRSWEVRDTSRMVFLDSAGDTIKEKIVIKEIIEREHQLSKESETWLKEITKQTDSLLSANKVLSEKVDSILHIHDKTTVVEKEVPWYEQLSNNICLIIVLSLLIYIIYQKVGRKVFSS